MGEWRGPELDAAAAEALAVVTLYASGSADDAALAAPLLDELRRGPRGVEGVVGGLISVASTLLVMLEFESGMAPPVALRAAGRLIAEAAYAPRSL